MITLRCPVVEVIADLNGMPRKPEAWLRDREAREGRFTKGTNVKGSPTTPISQSNNDDNCHVVRLISERLRSGMDLFHGSRCQVGDSAPPTETTCVAPSPHRSLWFLFPSCQRVCA